MLFPDLTNPPPSLEQYFTDQMPFGPINAAPIEDQAIAAFLLNPHTPFFSAMVKGQSVVVGRRGAGKSAIVNALRDPLLLAKYLNSFEKKTRDSVMADVMNIGDDRTLVVDIPADYEMTEVNSILRKKGLNVPVELRADIWLGRIWLHAIVQLGRKPQFLKKLSPASRERIELATRSLDPFQRSTVSANDCRKFLKSNADPWSFIQRLRSEFREKKLRVVFLIDSIDEYRIRESSVSDVLGGLLTLIANIQVPTTPEIIKAALPAETYRALSGSTNPAKIQPYIEHIEWKPIELMKIATHRLLLALYYEDAGKYQNLVGETSVEHRSSREFIRRIWSTIVGADIEHECRERESVIAYVLRHTQLNPRHMLAFLTNCGTLALRENGSVTFITPDLIAKNIQPLCKLIIDEVIYGHKNVYPDFGEVLRLFMPRCKSRMSYGELQSVYGKSSIKKTFPHHYTDNFSQFLKALLEAGVFGTFEQETDRYLEGRFDYNAPGTLRYNEHSTFLAHPAFAKEFFDGSNGSYQQKPVLPSGSVEGV